MGALEDKKYVIVDVDGTLMNITNRRHYLETKPQNWDAFNQQMIFDTPNLDIVQLVALLSNNYEIVFCTGRDDRYRSITKKQITQAFLTFKGVYNNINFGKLLMRPNDSKITDVELKTKLIDNHPDIEWSNIAYVLEDRDSVVEMWRSHDVRCLQVAPGNF